MKKRLPEISYFVAIFLMAALTITFLIIALRYDAIYQSELNKYVGLAPDFNVGREFSSSQFDSKVDAYIEYIVSLGREAPTKERAVEILNDNYTLINNTYYFNPYLESGSMNLRLYYEAFAIVALVFFILLLCSGIAYVLFFNKGPRKNNDVYYAFLYVFTLLSLNIYGFRYVKKERKISA